MTVWTGYVQIGNGRKLPVTDETLTLARQAATAGLRVDIYEETSGPIAFDYSASEGER